MARRALVKRADAERRVPDVAAFGYGRPGVAAAGLAAVDLGFGRIVTSHRVPSIHFIPDS